MAGEQGVPDGVLEDASGGAETRQEPVRPVVDQVGRVPAAGVEPVPGQW